MQYIFQLEEITEKEMKKGNKNNYHLNNVMTFLRNFLTKRAERTQYY